MLTMVKFMVCTGVIAMAFQAVEPKLLPLVREYRKHALGLFDISSDGELLLMHEYRRSTYTTTKFRARVLRARNGDEVASIDIELPTELGERDFSESRQMFFLPQSHRVVLVGTVETPRKSREEAALLLWTPETEAIERIAELLNGHTFIGDVWDNDSLLCYRRKSLNEWPARATGREFFLYNLITRKSKPIHVRDGEFRYHADHPIIRSPDGSRIAGKTEGIESSVQIRDLREDFILNIQVPRDFSVVNYRFSPNGKRFAILSVFRELVTGTEDGTKGRSDVPLLSIYESASGLLLAEHRILDYVRPFAKKVRKLPAAENYLVSTGEFLEFSNDGKFLAVSFGVGSGNTGRHSPRVAVFRFPSLEPTGFAQHPDVNIGVGEFIGKSAIGGRLRFSADDRYIFTTSKFTKSWLLPSN